MSKCGDITSGTDTDTLGGGGGAGADGGGGGGGAPTDGFDDAREIGSVNNVQLRHIDTCHTRRRGSDSD